MLSLSELLRVFLAQPADNCERRQLRLLCEPGFDRSKMRGRASVFRDSPLPGCLDAGIELDSSGILMAEQSRQLHQAK